VKIERWEELGDLSLTGKLSTKSGGPEREQI